MCNITRHFQSLSKLWYFYTILTAISFSCTHDVAILDELDEVCFQEQVLPVIQNSCGISGCHSAQSSAGGFRATDYNNIMRYVTPGDARGSEIYRLITDINSTNMMPPDKPLSREQRMLIQVWIEQGAKNTSCPENPVDTGAIFPPNPDTTCFVQDVLPIFQSSCATTGCHDAITHAEGYRFTSYATITQNPESVVPFNPNESKVYKVITEDEADDRMPPPPNNPLTAEQIAVIRKWILEGAINSDCPDLNCDTLNTISFSNQVLPIIQTNCTGCHSSVTTNGGITLENYSDVYNVSTSLVNGTPLLVGTIRRMNGFIAMPPSTVLDECTIRTIELWIDQGISDN